MSSAIKGPGIFGRFFGGVSGYAQNSLSKVAQDAIKEALSQVRRQCADFTETDPPTLCHLTSWLQTFLYQPHPPTVEESQEGLKKLSKWFSFEKLQEVSARIQSIQNQDVETLFWEQVEQGLEKKFAEQHGIKGDDKKRLLSAINASFRTQFIHHCIVSQTGEALSYIFVFKQKAMHKDQLLLQLDGMIATAALYRLLEFFAMQSEGEQEVRRGALKALGLPEECSWDLKDCFDELVRRSYQLCMSCAGSATKLKHFASSCLISTPLLHEEGSTKWVQNVAKKGICIVEFHRSVIRARSLLEQFGSDIQTFFLVDLHSADGKVQLHQTNFCGLESFKLCQIEQFAHRHEELKTFMVESFFPKCKQILEGQKQESRPEQIYREMEEMWKKVENFELLEVNHLVYFFAVAQKLGQFHEEVSSSFFHLINSAKLLIQDASAAFLTKYTGGGKRWIRSIIARLMLSAPLHRCGQMMENIIRKGKRMWSTVMQRMTPLFYKIPWEGRH